ncbi:hypothetical protein MLD38_008509 [Melastoma candidum]|uniref:Uncharacterized protein n=1 Tax=Melastoma candidum TaxID=119954 RepID=A0ACB9RU70_9MYRT|nr:hypothetical protein MLD38_008509 [Melastoma candidum]
MPEVLAKALLNGLHCVFFRDKEKDIKGLSEEFACFQHAVPSWLCKEEVTYVKKKNHVLRAVLIGVVFSINGIFPEPLRHQIPTVVGIQAKILTKDGITTTLPLQGIPKTTEDQVSFCRFLDFHPLVSKLQEGDKLQVAAQNPLPIPGVELKKCGVHLVFETENEYTGDEQSRDESYISLSEKLARFLNSQEVVT